MDKPSFGLFKTRMSAKQAARTSSRVKKAIPSLTAVKAAGVTAVRNMNPKAVTPNMAPTCAGEGLLYVLGGFPSKASDRAGSPFKDYTGQLLRTLSDSEDVMYDYVCRTRPPAGKDGTARNPKPHELLAFEAEVTASIEKARPNMVLAIGKVAANWATLGSDQILALAGQTFVRRFGTHETYVVPVMDPEFLMNLGDSRYHKVPSSEFRRFFEERVREVAAEAEAPRMPTPKVMTKAEALKDIEILIEADDVIAVLKTMRNCGLGGFDFETWRLRPYYSDARILSVSLDDGERVVAFCVDHEMYPWKADERLAIIDALRDVFESGYWVAHNLQFDLEWAIHLLGRGFKTDRFGCSLLRAWSINPGAPGNKGPLHLSLDFQVMKEFGVRVKQLTTAAASRSDLRGVARDELLLYNGVDARFHRLLYARLTKRCAELDVEATYQMRRRRMPTLLTAQAIGLPVCQETVEACKERIVKEKKQVLKDLLDTDGSKKFFKVYGAEFDPGDDDHKRMLFRDILGMHDGLKADGSYTLDKKLLRNAGGDFACVAQTIRFGELLKLLSTYVEKMAIDHPDSYVFPDGRIHGIMSGSRTRSGRLAIEQPSLQNFPSRTDKWVRSQIKAARAKQIKKQVVIHGDFGQIEARVLAMESRDPVWIQMLRDDYDVHFEWAEKMARLSPHSYAKFGDNDIKQFRSFIKNGFVFPLFYGASINSVAHSCELDLGLAQALGDEFWDTFIGVKTWQRAQWDFYQQNGYVVSMTGTKRFGPISFNMAINCVDYETELLTDRGWVNGCDLSTDDQVLTKNAKSGGLEWQRPTDVKHWPDYEGPVTTIKSKSFSAVTTPDHRWLVDANGSWSSRCVTTAELTPEHRIHRTGQYDAVEASWTDDELEVAGWFLTDGRIKREATFDRPGKTGPKSDGWATIQLMQAETKHADRIAQLLDRVGGCVSQNRHSVHKHVRYWSVRSPLAQALVSLFPQRTLTAAFLTTLSGRQLKHLFDIMMLGDGTAGGEKDSFVCSTRAKADAFAMLCVMIGSSTSTSQRPGKSWFEVTVLRRKRVRVTPVHTKTTREKRGMWCPMVPNAYFVARRAGVTYITGNTPIQGTASDINVEGMIEMHDRAIEQDKPYLHPLLQIHDALVNICDEDDAEDTIVQMVESVFAYQPSWMADVPLTFEVEIGDDLANLEAVGTFRSDEL